MPLIVPQLDDRSYADILQEALKRIGVHNPEWTNFNDSDPGVTILQLFSFMQENLLYRANLIPERNRLRFLTLLGITLRPATAARGVITIVNERGPMQTVTLPANLPVFAGKVGFVTTNGLDILPVEMKPYYRRPLTTEKQQAAQQTYGQLYSTFTDDPADLDFYETIPLDPPVSAASIPSVSLTNADTVDGILWLALLARSSEANQTGTVLSEIRGKTLTLGIMPVFENASRVLPPGGVSAAQGQATLQYSISTGVTDSARQLYQPLEAREDGNPLQDLTLIQLTIPSTGEIGTWGQSAPIEDGVGDYPPAIEDPTVANRLLAWIRIQLAPNANGTAPTGLNAAFSWVGINSARVTQRIQVIAEPLGTGTGEPDQILTLANTPVIPDSVLLAVDGELWLRVDDLMAAPAEVPVRDPALPPGAPPPPAAYPTAKVFTVDGESGQVKFGTGLFGARPPSGAVIVASYAYGGRSDGNVGIGSISSSPRLPAGFKVDNPLPSWGGDDGQTVDQAERSIPAYLQHGGRAVSTTDFRQIVSETPGVALGRVEILPLFSPDQPDVPAPGTVTVLAIPNGPGAPAPDRAFLDAICAYLDPRRLVTTEVHVRGPEYVSVWVSIGIDVVAGRDIAPVREAVRRAVRDYFSPIPTTTGPGWPLSKTVETSGVMIQALRVDGVGNIRGVFLWDSAKTSISQLAISGLKLPKLEQITVTAGDAQDITAAEPQPGKKRVIVPMLQPQC